MQIILFFVIFSFSFNNLAASDLTVLPQFLVSIESHYKTENSLEQLVAVKGYGVLIKKDDKIFVLCDSHLSQGTSSIRIMDYQGKLIEWNSRLANNDADIEMFEIIETEINDVFYYSEFSSTFVLDSDKIPAKLTKTFFKIGSDTYLPIHPNLVKKALEFNKTTRNSTYESGLYGYASENHEKRDRGFLQKPFDNQGWFSDSSVVPGMSGAPALKNITLKNKNYWSILGLTTGYHRYFNRSYLTDIQQINQLISNYEKGLRERTSLTKWKFDRFLYRDYGNNTLEINPLKNLSGSAIHLSSGGGSGGDSGGGSGGDSGESSVSNKFINFTDLNIKWGMKYLDKETFVFQINDLLKMQPPVFIFASPNGLSLAKSIVNQDMNFTFESKGFEEINFHKIFAERLKLSSAYNRDSDLKLLNLDSGDCLIDQSPWETSESNSKITLRLPKINIEDKPMIVTLDLLSWKNAASFKPFIVIPNSNKPGNIILDVKGLFFVDPTDLDKTLLSPGELYRSLFLGIQSSEANPVNYVKCYKTKNKRAFQKDSP